MSTLDSPEEPSFLYDEWRRARMIGPSLGFRPSFAIVDEAADWSLPAEDDLPDVGEPR